MGMPLTRLFMVRTPPPAAGSSEDGGEAGTVHIRPEAHPAPRGRPNPRGVGVRLGERTGGRFSISAPDEQVPSMDASIQAMPLSALLGQDVVDRLRPPAENAWETACASGSG
ncbi:hypothetical protein ACH492_38300 [Streptomyces sp. NPDC019443]|uniref:hypothetical protein n=1 Tax=Streptomyces sp. NPDC019443 TaxID=3365061 RepID=UPI0037884B7C